MNVEQCKALGFIPYAVYGGKVESFKVRETQPDAYSDPMLLIVLDQLLANTDGKAHIQELKDERGRHLALWSSVAGVVRRLLPEVEAFNSETAVETLHALIDEMKETREYLGLVPEDHIVLRLREIEAEGAKERESEARIVATPFDICGLCSGTCGHYWRAGDGHERWKACPVCAELNALKQRPTEQMYRAACGASEQHRKRAEAAKKALAEAERERDALAAQITAGEPFDAEEIEKIKSDVQIQAVKDASEAFAKWVAVMDPRANRGLDKPLLPTTPKPGSRWVRL